MVALSERREHVMEWLVLVTVIFGTFLGGIDRTVVNLALPHIIQDFGITVSTAGWVATAYILANAVFVPVWGKLGDTIGRKKVYLTGFVVFILGSVLAGLSWNFSSLLIFRVIQAIAVSADYPTAMAIIAFTFRDSKRRAQALGLWSASLAASAVLGPLIGGPLIDGFGWRAIFFINVPIGIVGALMALAFVQESENDGARHAFDFAGAITLGVALSALVLVLDKGSEWGWLSFASILSYAVGVVFAITFYFIERHHDEPIVDFKFFKNSAFNLILGNTFFVFMGMMGSVFLIPLFAETFLGYDATTAGYLFIPMALFIFVSAPIGARLSRKIKAGYIIGAGTLLASIGMLLMAHNLDAKATALQIILSLGVMALGMGLGMAPRTNLIASSVPKHEVGVASSIFVLVRNIAGAFGIAISTTLLANFTKANAISIAHWSTLNTTNVFTRKEFIGLIELKAQINAFKVIFLVAAVAFVIGGILAFWIRVSREVEGEAIPME